MVIQKMTLWFMGMGCQSSHALTQRDYPQSSGLSMVRTSFFHIFQAALSHPPLLLSRLLFTPFSPQNPVREKFTFLKILAIFRLLETFLSYQQVINNEPFSTQFLKLFRRISGFLNEKLEPAQKCITLLERKR